ncbi:MAG: BTAD domain-containing putative transcriptional regulator [Mycobacteriales bacterium]|nr:AAA family ATPase [Frankia sp.]
MGEPRDALRIRLLGGLEIEGVEQRALGSRKARLLLKVLALARGAMVPTDVLVDRLWGEDPPARPGDQVSVLVSRLRNVLGATRLPRGDGGYTLVVDWLDVDELARLVAEADRRLNAGGATAALAAAAAAVALVRGPLLPDEPDAEWVEAERAAALRLAARARLVAADAALRTGATGEAAHLSAAVLDDDPYDESALRLYMRACGVAGRPAAALTAYDKVRRRLADELGTDPAPATVALYEQLLQSGTVELAEPGTAVEPQWTLPGRDRELAALDRALDAAATRAQLVVVEGEAGIGKSRLLDEWAQRVHASAAVLRGRCDVLGRSLPLQAILDALVSALRGLDKQSVDELLGADAAVVGPLLGFGGAVAGVDALANEQLSQAVVFAAVLEVLLRLAGSRTVVLLVDDVHLADDATTAWLGFAVRRATHRRLLLVVARRVGQGPTVRADATITLGPLDRVAAEAAVGADRAAAVYERSGGNPLFLLELAAAGTDGVPESLRAAVAQRCDALGEPASTLRAAAVLGPEIDLEVLGATLHRAPAQLLDDLEASARAGLLSESGTRFVFRHELVREALEADTGAARRALLHRAALFALRGRGNADALAVAFHAEQAGELEVAADALCDAAVQATQRYDYAAAATLLDRAATHVELPRVRRIRAQVSLLRNDRAAAVDEAAAILAAAPEDPDALEVAAQVAYYAQRDFARAAQLSEQAAKRASSDDQRARCLGFAGRAMHAAGRLADADAYFDLAGDTVPSARTYRGSLRLHQGRHEEALELLTGDDRSDSPFDFAPALSAMLRGLALAGLGRPLAALAEMDRMDAHVTRRGLARYGGRSDNCRGYVLRNLGALHVADDWNVRGGEHGRSSRQDEPQAHSLLDLADSQLERGDLGEAARLLDAAQHFQQVAHTYQWRHVLRSRLLRSRLLLAAGDYTAAEEQAVAVRDEAQGFGVPRYELFARLAIAQARLRGGGTVDLDAVAADLGGLDGLAGMDAWRVTADVAADAGVAAWRSLAEQRVALLAATAGPYAETLRDYATVRFDRQRTVTRTT